MILYFTDRKMQILGYASTGLMKGFSVSDDNKVQEIETGTATFECTIPFKRNERSLAENMTQAGNYIIRHNGGDDEFYTIIQTELDTESQEIYLYAEDAGLDLLNEIVPQFPDTEMGDDASDTFTASIDWYMKKWLQDTGFEIGINEIDDSIKKKLSASESTLMERILEIASLFGAEIGFSFTIKQMAITKKYLNIYKKRGKTLNKKLYLDREIKRITIQRSIENVATALQVVGGNNLAGVPVTLDDYTYDDGDFYLGDRKDYPDTAGKKKLLYSRRAREVWSRYSFDGEPGKLANGTGDIIKVFRSELTDKKALLETAVAELTKMREPDVNYEVEFNYLPEDISIGDVVDLIDEFGELYLSSRILKLEESVANDTRTATMGEYLIKSSGISQQVLDLAERFRELSGTTAVAAALVYDHLYEMASDGVTANFTAYLYEGKKEITRSFPAENYTWYKKTEDGMEYIGSGYTISVDTSELGFGGTVTGRFVSLGNTGLTDASGNGIQTSGGNTLTGRTDAEGFVKVTDLPVQAPTMTDKLLGIGTEQEYQMTIQDLKDLIGRAMSYGDLTDKPKIEGITLEGDKTYEDLNLQNISNSELENILKI